MQAPGTPSVDQLLVLLTVVEEGSFSAAAKRLRRATSAISYAIDTLEAQLGLPLFDRGTTRKPRLTPVGRLCPARGDAASGAEPVTGPDFTATNDHSALAACLRHVPAPLRTTVLSPRGQLRTAR